MIPLFDGHCDTLSMCFYTGQEFFANTGNLDLERMMACYVPYAQFFAIFSNSDWEGPPMWERFLGQEALFRREIEKNSNRITLCLTAQQAQQAAREGKAAAFLSVEGAELLECSLERLEQAYAMGVRAVNPTWNHANQLSGSHKDRPEEGLTPQGRAFVRRMRALGVLIDVSHLSDRGFWDLLETAPGPVIATHSNSRSIFFHTRNLTDEQITAIIDQQGVIGLNLYPGFLGEDPDLETAVAHLDHILELGGAHTVALGGDWDGVECLPRGVQDARGWLDFYRLLQRKNYPEPLLQDLFYNNMMRIVREVCSTSAQET